MSELIHLPETMRRQWLAFERALGRWAPTQGFAPEFVGVVMDAVRAHYLACAVPDSELRRDDYHAAFAELQDWAVLVAYRLALRIVELELHRDGVAATKAQPGGPLAISGWPVSVARQWQSFCANVRRSVPRDYRRTAVDAALAALAPLWLELARPLPPLTVWGAPDEAERRLQHLNDWAFTKQLTMLQGLVRVEYELLALALAPVPAPSTAAFADAAAVLPFPARCDSG